MRLKPIVFALATLVAAGCSGSNTPTAPTPPPPTTATLVVKVDIACNIRNIQSADVYVDSNWMGVAHAGDSGISEVVSIGNHSITAESYYANGVLGYYWGPLNVAVPAAGLLETLRCQ
jgi:hypothetical protein